MDDANDPELAAIPVDPRVSRRRGERAPGRRDARALRPADATKVRVSLRLGAEAARRLKLHALQTSDDIAAIIDRLIIEHLPHYSVRTHPRGSANHTGEDRQDDAA